MNWIVWTGLFCICGIPLGIFLLFGGLILLAKIADKWL